jgi:hypothetical protein
MRLADCLRLTESIQGTKPPHLSVGSLSSIENCEALRAKRGNLQNPKSIGFPNYAKLKVKAFLNFSQTSSKIYELFNRPFGNHAVHISANLCSPNDF